MRTQGEIYSEDINVNVKIGRSTGLGIGHAYGEPDDAQTWATAHNVANKLDATGMDGFKAIEGLPQFIKDAEATSGPDALWVLFDDFMQSIQREDDEPTT